jgi:hypothetical protein
MPLFLLVYSACVDVLALLVGRSGESKKCTGERKKLYYSTKKKVGYAYVYKINLLS